MGLSPMMQHYLKVKEEYPGTIVFYRLGDFYEMFFDDAKLVSKELELTLTGRDCGLEERAPMCGVPFHAAETYIKLLVDKGYKVSICEQVEDPKTAKGMVKREVIRIVTPGTILNQESLKEEFNNYICCVSDINGTLGFAIADISTGICRVTCSDEPKRIADELIKFAPSEIVLSEDLSEEHLICRHADFYNIAITRISDWYYSAEEAASILQEHFHTDNMISLGIADFPSEISAVGALFRYLYDTQKNTLEQMTAIRPYLMEDYMLIDSYSRRNLELTETLREKEKRGSLLWVLDKTGTAMGARLLRASLEQPLIKKDVIEKRLDAVEELNARIMDRDEMREYLSAVYDLERLMSRISNRTAGPRDLKAFEASLKMLPDIKAIAQNFKSALLLEKAEQIDPCEELYRLLSSAIEDMPPVTVREGGIIKSGYQEEVDRLRELKTNGKQWLLKYEEEEKQRTGIKNLRIRYNRVFGYYLEVTKLYQELVPEDYVRKQTLANAERYTTDRLKELEDEILGAEDKLINLEYDLFCEIREQAAAQVKRIQTSANAIAVLDMMCSLSYVAGKNRYVRPSINEEGYIDIKEGRHPVIEKMMRDELFIPNDIYLDQEDNRISIITGPNMAGKSTFMRQCALIVLMASVGSFVPATAADICIVGRIFTRVGASDDLASGQSTFMVEMTEVANILRNATKNSLLILDEIGRGTSTFDGLSIAWAVTEFIANREKIGAKTLFATHYHELTELEGKLDGVKNYCIAVKEKGEDIVFLRKIVRGGADKSYGIQVARLAGIPKEVTNRAKELVYQLSSTDITETVKDIAASVKTQEEESASYTQMSLFTEQSEDSVISELKELDLSVISPIEALNKLFELQTRLKQ